MNILLVEDDVLLSTALTQVLVAHHYTIVQAGNEQAALNRVRQDAYDLILLGGQVPSVDGIRLCQHLRSQNYPNPILLLIETPSDAEVMAGFAAGADDYLDKRCPPDVLLAKVQTWLRRSQARSQTQPPKPASTVLTWGHLCLDRSAGRVTLGEQVIPLTATEYNLLELFLEHPDRIFSRSAILDQLWGFDHAPTDRAIITHIKDVRKKLKAGGLTEDLIETIYGMGYRLKPAPSLSSPPPLSPAERHQPRLAPQVEDPFAIHRLLIKFRQVFQAQVAVLEQAKVALLAGHWDPELQQSARQEAHKLAGSLASFGYPEGSRLARSAEHLLSLDRPLQRDEIQRFEAWITALQQELAQPVVSKAPTRATATAHRVLVIDDDKTLTDRLTAESPAWGLHLKVIASLAVARSYLAITTPDVVLLDLSFSNTSEDGLTLLQELNEHWPQLPVIIFTGRDSLADRLAVSRLGARQFLTKPATTVQIFRAIARVLPKPQATDAKVLVVDDDDAILATFSTLLTPWGLDVIALTEPQRFWEVLLTTMPQVVVLDLEMPQVSGLELCQVVRQDSQWGDIPILVVTAHADPESLQQAFAAGADDFITKPVLGPELVTRILSRIERTRFRQRWITLDLHPAGGMD